MTVTEIEKKDSKDDLYTDTTVLNPADLSDGELDDKEKDLGGKVLTVDVLDDQGNIKPPEPEKNAKGEYIIRTGSDAAHYLLSLRDDGDPSLTVRSFVIGTVFAAACSVMSMYSTFLRLGVGLGGSFLGIVIYFTGRFWARILPRGDHLEAKWRQRTGGEGQTPLPLWIRFFKVLNPQDFGLKEHVVAFMIAGVSTSGQGPLIIFAVQDLFYDQRVQAGTVGLSVLSMTLFGYGLAGVLRPMTVWAVESVYWTQIPQVQTFQGMHWEKQLESKRMQWFWGLFGLVAVYEVFPTYVFPWLSAISIPCLAAMHTTGKVGQTLTNIFGGSMPNEGMGLFMLSLDWGSIGSESISMPLKLQGNRVIGLILAYITTVAVYYGNAWNALNYPFQATSLRRDDGSRYLSTKIFDDGILNLEKLKEYGLPHLAGTYAWGLVVANAALGGLFAHVLLFWSKDIVRTVRHWREQHDEDPHHAAMRKYPEAPMWWYIAVMVFGLVTGLACCATQDIQLPWWAFIVALVLGCAISPFSNLLFARFGNGIATNNLCKMVGGAIIPGRPVGLLYFANWSHYVIEGCVNLSSDLKLGEYTKVPPRVMFFAQVWSTIFGAFISYPVLRTVLDNKRDILRSAHGNAQWTGVNLQGSETNATTWALSKYLYSSTGEYFLVPLAVVFGFAAVTLHWLFEKKFKKIGPWATNDYNLPVIIQNMGGFSGGGVNNSDLMSISAGFFSQIYLRDYHPRIFKDYLFLLASGMDGGGSFSGFILTLAVFGAVNAGTPFPIWWGNPDLDASYIDHCPAPE